MTLALASRRTALTPPWVRNDLWRRARSVPSLDLRFADNKSLTDAVTGASLVTFTRASSGTYTDSAGVLQTAATDVPRFDHNPATGESLGLLVEGQRTNLLLRSEEFDNASWAKNGTPTVTANSSVAPDGTTTAKLFTRTTTGPSYIQQIFVKAASALTYTFSIYAKQSVGNFIALRAQGAYPARADVVFNLSTGAITSAASVVAGFASASATITPLVNGWYRLTLTATTDAVTNFQIVISANSNIVQIDGIDSASNSACYLWGAQLEAGAFPTSYIPTTSAAATRSADVASITGTNFSSWYRQDEGTVFVDAKEYPFVSSAVRSFYGFENSSQVNTDWHRQWIWNGAPTQLLHSIYTSSSGPIAVDFSIPLVNEQKRAALAYRVNDYARSYNGAAPTTDTSGNLPVGIDRLGIGSNNGVSQVNGTIRRLIYFPNRLPNSTLQTITS